jgi:signal transduction histidine kinase/tetratricopeptide (TPR) repeat protein
MFVLGGALGWLGWQLLKQDRALEGQRLQERLELAADHMAAALQQSLTDLESYLSFVPSPGAKEPPDGVMVLQVTKRTVNAYPPGCLLYYPVIPDGEEPPAATFVAGETLEYAGNDPAKAAELFRELARSPDPGVRAGALLRLGRNLRKTGRHEEALQVYGELAQLGRTSVLGLPAELMAREARGTVLETIGKGEELRKEAALLHAALWNGRWSLLRPAWEFHVEEAQRWSGATPLTEREQIALALSIAAESIYGQWIAEPESKGRRILKIEGRAFGSPLARGLYTRASTAEEDPRAKPGAPTAVEGRPVLISWTGPSDRLAAVLAGPGYLVSKWKEFLQGRRVQGALVDADGQVMIGSFNKSGPQAVRTAPATRLPGTLYATSADPGADEAGFAGRRRLLLSGFAVLALVLLAGSYFIMRSIDRERAVSRLQSEFVSTVSHEFRTPLTSLRQLSEMLSKGRVPTEDLRQKSYDILSRESERLQRLVESLLDFGRIEARAFLYHYEHLDPVTLVGDLVAEFQEKAAAQGYHVELEFAGEYPLIHADREALGLALRNLLDNAVKYSPDCRTVWVEMARERGRLAIRVRDQGMGIPASEQKEIFKRFVRGTGSRAAHIQGTGIGLAMARHIIEAHDGEIRLESKPGRGSTFTILLPLEKMA